MQTNTSKPRIFRKPIVTMGALALFAGMLFWTKLRLVSDIPRSAYAVPKEQQQPPAPATVPPNDASVDESPDGSHDEAPTDAAGNTPADADHPGTEPDND